jgi:hypothetical protein
MVKFETEAQWSYIGTTHDYKCSNGIKDYWNTQILDIVFALFRSGKQY